MEEAKIVQIGAGMVAKIRRQNYPQGSKVVALVVRNVPKYLAILKKNPTVPKNVLITNNVKAVAKKFGQDLTWDLVADDETHLGYVKKILKVCPTAKIIIGKTPYRSQLIGEFKKIQKQYQKAKITITENYTVSQVTQKVLEMMRKYQILAKKITLEFTKNRIKDIEKGRFIHGDIGVLGYEGSHMITILEKLGVDITRIVNGNFEDLQMPTGKILKNQGSAFFTSLSKTGEIVFYTAMNGKVLNKLPKLGINFDIAYGNERRFRILILEDGNWKIIGQFDPVPGLRQRPFGRVLVMRNHQIVEKIDKIYDNTIRATLEQQICFLQGSGCPNPMPIEKAKNFTILETVYQKFKN